MTIQLGSTARRLRESLGLTQRAAARALGISAVHLCNLEKNKAFPSPELLDRYRKLWGIDLYVLAWCQNGKVEHLPSGMRNAMKELERGWKAQIAKAIT